MRLGIMQPYFFPYLGYFSLIKHVDMFILLDDVQFIRHGWIERNRILHPSDGWQYIKVPLNRHQRETKIRDITINNNQNWKGRILSQLDHYKKVAPFFYKVITLLKANFSNDYFDISHLNKTTLEAVCNYLGISTSIEIFSEMNLSIDKISTPDDWALNISKAMDADEYWNPIGGINIFDKSKYEKNNISLKFQKINFSPYFQTRDTFESGLSILDVLMFNNPKEINKFLNDFEAI